MKKLCFLFFLFLIASEFGFAQIIVVAGTVANEQKEPLRFAFLYDKQTQNATYSDSLGRFKLKVSPASQIMASCKGYVDAAFDVAGRANFDLVLKSDPSAAANSSTKEMSLLQEAFKKSNFQAEGTTVTAFGAFPVFTNQKQTVGSRFLFNQWVHGYVIKTSGGIEQNSSLYFNYDKMTGDLYLTQNLNSAMVADKNVIKGFMLFSPGDQPFNFEMMTGINTSLYCQVLSSGNKYKIYKLIKTKFIPSNYKTDGLTSTGNIYDEYADDYTYYIQNVTTTAFQPLSLRKKAIKEAFAADADKVTSFMASHNGKIDDDYLKSLGDTLNQ